MSISWNVFKLLSPVVLPLNPQQEQQFDRAIGRIYGARAASIMSISWIMFY